MGAASSNDCLTDPDIPEAVMSGGVEFISDERTTRDPNEWLWLQLSESSQRVMPAWSMLATHLRYRLAGMRLGGLATPESAMAAMVGEEVATISGPPRFEIWHAPCQLPIIALS